MQESVQPEITTIESKAISAVLIANPTSGSYIFHGHQITETVSYLQSQGWQVRLQLTQCQGDARRLTRTAVEAGIDVVIAVGGDGTINEIIQELAGSKTALGLLPCGTVNVWAREVGIPLDIVKAREVLLHGQTRRIDLGKINDHYFLLMAGIGVDGAVAHAVEQKPVKRLGVLGYLLLATWLGIGYQAFRLMLDLNGQSIKLNGMQMVVGNTQLYAGAMKYTWQARCDDGLLDICIVRKRGPIGRFQVLLDFLLHREERHQWVHYATSSTIKLSTQEAIAIQVDGEPYGYTKPNEETIFTSVPHALKVIIPTTAPDTLFEQKQTES